MAKAAKVRISQCMIVKNEEKNIERALSWGKGIVSEQIVVDTGSTDRTVDIARQMGAKVYEFQWIDDFAAAKNYAIGKAKYEWIAFLDADEYFTPEDGRKLLNALRLLHDTGAESILTGWVNLDNQGNIMFVGTQRRIFRNLPFLRYKGRIHESLTTKEGHLIDTVDMVEELSIFHTGYGDQENAKKSGRNLKLIQEELKDNPDNYEMWGYLGQEHVSAGQWAEAEEAFWKAVHLMPDKIKGIYDANASLILLRLIEVLINREEPSEETLMKAYELAVEGWPQEADYDYYLGKYFAGKGNWQKGETHLRQALTLLETYSNTGKSMVLSGEIQRAYELLAVCCYNNGKYGDCVQLTTALLKGNPYLMSTAMVLLMAFSKDPEISMKGEEGARAVAEFLGGNFYDFNSLKDRLFVLRAAMSAGYADLVRIVRGMFTPEELKSVDQALK